LPAASEFHFSWPFRGLDEGVNLTVLQRVAKISLDEIDLLRLAPNWQDRVDASPGVYRGLRGARGYRFDAMRFADMTIPTLLLSGSESPLYLRLGLLSWASDLQETCSRAWLPEAGGSVFAI